MKYFAKGAAVGILCAIIGIGFGNGLYQIAKYTYKAFYAECQND